MILRMLLSKIAFIAEQSTEMLVASTPESLDPSLLQTSTELQPGDYGTAFIKMFLTLIALIGLFALTVWFLRRLIRQKLERGTGEQRIQVLEKKMISPKTTLYVIEHEGQKLLFAESQLEIRALTTQKIPKTFQEIQ